MQSELPQQEPFRIVLWGAGTLIAAVTRHLAKLPDFRIVGMLCYNPDKSGKDIGDILGLPPLGVHATDDKAKIFGIEADCVLVCAKDAIDHTDLDNDVIQLLESGKNVVSSTSYFYPPMRGGAYEARLLAACRKGGVSLHGAGEHPAMMCDRLALTLTGFCTDVEHITVREYADIGSLANPAMLAAAGIGRTPAQIAESSDLRRKIWGPLYEGMIGFMANVMFQAGPERLAIEAEVNADLTDTAFSLSPDFVVPAGTAVCTNQRYTGYVDGRKFITLHLHWAYGIENSPARTALKPGQTHHLLEIEGKPISVRMTLDGQASFARDLVRDPEDSTIPIYNLVVAPILQSIPMVCRAPVGFVYETALTHYRSSY